MLPSQGFQSLSPGGANPGRLLEDVSTSALQSVRIGELAGKRSTGVRNVFGGYEAGADTTAASDSVLLGFQSGKSASTLKAATFVGALSGMNATRSDESTLVGYAAGQFMVDAKNNVGIGAWALREATCINTTAVGIRALERALDADNNTGVGCEVMQNMRSGSDNTAVGFQCMRGAFTVMESTSIGAYAGYCNTRGTGLTLVGYKAGQFMEEGYFSVAVGISALASARYSSNAVAIGPFAGAGATNTTGAVLLGYGVGSAAAGVDNSVLIGANAAHHFSGGSTVAIGESAAPYVIGNDNVVVGARALANPAGVQATGTVAIGADVAPTLEHSVSNVLIGAGADTFYASASYAISIGTENALTNDRGITIGGNIENQRIASVLMGNDLSSDADNSVIVGKDISVDSVIFFKDPLLAPYTDAVSVDALSKLGAVDIGYTNILATPGYPEVGSRAFLTVAQAGYLMEAASPASNSSYVQSPLAVSPASFDLRTHAPDGAYLINQGAVFLPVISSDPVPQAIDGSPAFSNVWSDLVSKGFVGVTVETILSMGAPATLADVYRESHDLSIDVSVEPLDPVTLNVVGLHCNVLPLPYRTPKYVPPPLATATTTTEPEVVYLGLTEAEVSIPYASLTAEVPDLHPQNRVVITDVAADPPRYGAFLDIHTTDVKYQRPIENMFAPSDTFGLRPVRLLQESASQLWHGFASVAFNTVSVVTSNATFFVPSDVSVAMLSAPNLPLPFSKLLTYAPAYAPAYPGSANPVAAVPFRITGLPADVVFNVPGATFTSANIATMIAENIDAYPESQRAPQYTIAEASILTATSDIQAHVYPLVPNAIQQAVTSLETLQTIATTEPTDPGWTPALKSDLLSALGNMTNVAAQTAGITPANALLNALFVTQAWTVNTYPYINDLLTSLTFDATSVPSGPITHTASNQLKNATRILKTHVIDHHLYDVVTYVANLKASALTSTAPPPTPTTATLESYLYTLSNLDRLAYPTTLPPVVESTASSSNLYATWWYKFNVMPRLFTTFGNLSTYSLGTTSVNTVPSGAITFRAPSNLLDPINTVVTATIPIRAAPPSPHPSLDTQPTYVVEVPIGIDRSVTVPFSGTFGSFATCNILPPAYGHLNTTTAMGVQMVPTYTSAHPFTPDDTDVLIVGNANVGKPTQSVQITLTRPLGLYAAPVVGIYQAPSTVATWQGYDVTASVPIVASLSNVRITSSSNYDSTGPPPVRDETYPPITTYELLSTYDAAIGLRTVRTHTIHVNTIASGPTVIDWESVEADGSNVTTLNLTTTTNTIVYDLDAVIGEATPIVNTSVPVTSDPIVNKTYVTFPNDPDPNMTTFATVIGSNVTINILETRATAYNTFIDIKGPYIYANTVKTYVDGLGAATSLYAYVTTNATEDETVTTTQIVKVPLTGTVPQTQTVTRNYTANCNIDLYEPTAVLRPFQLSSNLAYASYNADQEVIVRNVGPVLQWSPSAMVANDVFVKLGPAPTVVAVTHASASATLNVAGYARASPGIGITSVASTSLPIDPESRRVPLSSFVTAHTVSTATRVHVIRADNGYVFPTTAAVDPQASLWYIPNPLAPGTTTYPASLIRLIYTNASNQVVAIVHATITVTPAPYAGGQGVALGLLRNERTVRSRTLQLRAFSPETDTFALYGFVTDTTGVQVSANWTLRDKDTAENVLTGDSASAPLPGTSFNADTSVNITRQSIADGRWVLSTSSANAIALDVRIPSTPVYLLYRLNTAEVGFRYFPIYPFQHDDFPLTSTAPLSPLRFTWFGSVEAIVRTTAFVGPFATDVAALRTSAPQLLPGPLPTTTLHYKLETALNYGMLYAGGIQRNTFTHQELVTKALTYIPFVPLDFRTEPVRFRLYIDGRASLLYEASFQPLWAPLLHTPSVDASKVDAAGRGLPGGGTSDLGVPSSLASMGASWVLDDAGDSTVPYATATTLPINQYIVPITLTTAEGPLFAGSRVYSVLPITYATPLPVTLATTVEVTIDEADRHALTPALLQTTYDPALARDLVFYVIGAPLHGVVTSASGLPLPRFTFRDAPFYQHVGGSLATDTVTIGVCSGPFDLSQNITLTFNVRKLPRITSMRPLLVYADAVAELALLRTGLFATDVTGVPDAYVHVLGSNLLVPEGGALHRIDDQDGPFQYRLDAALASLDAPYPELTMTVALNANAATVNPLIAIPEYTALFQHTARVYLNRHVSVQSFEPILQPSSNQGFNYTLDAAQAGFSNFINHTAGVYVEVQPTQPLVYSDGEALTQLAPLQQFAFVLEGLGIGSPGLEDPLFQILVTEANITYSSRGAPTQTFPLVSSFAFTFDQWNNLYFINSDPNNGRAASLYINYDFNATQIVNDPKNLFANVALDSVPAVDLAELRALRFNFDLNDVRNNRPGASALVLPLEPGGLQASFSLSNYATSLLLRNFEVLINTNATSGNSGALAPYDPTTYNIVLGKSLTVRGINNICIGSTFTTSGQNSIILGRNIGVVSGTGSQTVNDIYQSIIIGGDSFANAFVRDVIAIGKNNYNDLFLVPTEEVAEFLARKPILIGNDIDNTKVDYNINIGNAFLKTERLGPQIYLGNAGEHVGVGYTSNVGLQHALDVNGTLAATSLLVNGTVAADRVLGVDYADVLNVPEFVQLDSDVVIQEPVGSVVSYLGRGRIDDTYRAIVGQTVTRSDYIELANALGIPKSRVTFVVPAADGANANYGALPYLYATAATVYTMQFGIATTASERLIPQLTRTQNQFKANEKGLYTITIDHWRTSEYVDNMPEWYLSITKYLGGGGGSKTFASNSIKGLHGGSHQIVLCKNDTFEVKVSFTKSNVTVYMDGPDVGTSLLVRFTQTIV